MPRVTNAEMQRTLFLAGLRKLIEENEPFRKFVFAILTDAHIFEPTFDQGNDRNTSFREGRRSLGLHVLYTLKAAYPDILSVLSMEGDILATGKPAAENATLEDPWNEPPAPPPE